MKEYIWNLKDAVFTKDKGKVFSCFSCGGGSTMGYKLAGFDVIGCNEIDPKMMAVYKENHNPKYSFLESIETFKDREELPEELYDLDILDGSPPCSSFSMAGKRGKDWGKKKKFREGQQEQILDRLFFDFIDLAKRLQPKVVIAENVKGLLQGEALKYLAEIYKDFDTAGYYCQHFLLDGSRMGLPQKRQRVFFICIRKDLGEKFLAPVDMFLSLPKITLEFNEKPVPFGEFSEDNVKTKDMPDSVFKYWNLMNGRVGGMDLVHPKGSFFGELNVDETKPLPTIVATGKLYRRDIPRRLTTTEFKMGGSFPMDYNFLNVKPYYLIGMSVPPLMTKKVAEQIYIQWLSKL